MADSQLSGLDIAFLCLEGQHSPMHMGAVAVFTPGDDGPIDTRGLATLLAERAAGIPQLRRHQRTTLLPPGGATWVEDPHFDPAAHIRLDRVSTLYDDDPLTTYAGDWIAEPLPMDRPLWDLRLVDGLPGGAVALLLKLHHAVTDGAGAVGIGAGLLDPVPVPRRAAPTSCVQRRTARSPLDALRQGVSSALSQAGEGAAIASSVLRAARPYPVSPIAAPRAAQRRLGFVRLDLADIRRVRAAHGGTTNDVVLTVVAGALRDWLINRGRRADGRTLRALIPVSVRARAGAGATAGNQLSGYLCDLPVGLDDPVERLRAVRRSMTAAKRGGPTTGAGAFPLLAGRLPAGVHRLATRAAGMAAPLLFDTVVTTVPIPRARLTVGGHPLREVFPLVPLPANQALGIAVAVHRDAVHIGLQANGAAVPELGSLRDAFLKAGERLVQLCH
ncbi:wax ester/triacylglycerol synthase family O-acyltransferase [Amycolatopsis suaedae]|uniref:Diacylglycerol O-acyltransferase n=1 Tax=Amycolatopsis suaedae TaxID=2510978 RepID=A0A4Q7J0U2_9PSEU|nr:wax ester/triacylglycerol synthase family O-acyltransferase [Amycolatopsis suaedae]RZQ59993.1 wax ester/triacylglycerol synthase family O-acyltransferase [Amycolatopsis suaedae]